MRGRPALAQMRQRRDQTGDDVTRSGGLRLVRSQLPAGDPQRQARAEYKTAGGDDEQDRVGRVVRHHLAQDQPQHRAEAAPISTPAGPTVGTTELATMYSPDSMVCGSEADSAASRNRLRLIASSTPP